MAPCASFLKLCIWWEKMTLPVAEGLLFGAEQMNRCASLSEPPNKQNQVTNVKSCLLLAMGFVQLTLSY